MADSVCVLLRFLYCTHMKQKVLPVRPGGLCRRRLDGILSASDQIQSPLEGGLRKKKVTRLAVVFKIILILLLSSVVRTSFTLLYNSV